MHLDDLHDPGSIAREWERRALKPAMRYRFALENGEELEGDALRLAASGGLMLRTDTGERVVELADRVRIVR
jgi:hypothetical protein